MKGDKDHRYGTRRLSVPRKSDSMEMIRHWHSTTAFWTLRTRLTQVPEISAPAYEVFGFGQATSLEDGERQFVM